MITLLPLAAELPAAKPLSSASATDTMPKGALYRFRDAEGNLAINSVLPESAIQSGYEVIDDRGRVLQVVAPALPEAERKRMQKQSRMRQHDVQLKRLYPTPEDAERARDRQMSSLRLGIDYARGIIVQLDIKLADEVAKAAAAEGAGKPVPEVVQGNIELYTRQIRDQEEKIAGLERDMELVTKDFAPIIKRLHEIESGD